MKKHHKAKTDFKYVELARDLYEQGQKPTAIADYLGESINTVWDWISFKTRVSS